MKRPKEQERDRDGSGEERRDVSRRAAHESGGVLVRRIPIPVTYSRWKLLLTLISYLDTKYSMGSCSQQTSEDFHVLPYGGTALRLGFLFFSRRFSEAAGKHICNSVLIISSAENISQYWISWPLSPLLLFINYSNS